MARNDKFIGNYTERDLIGINYLTLNPKKLTERELENLKNLDLKKFRELTIVLESELVTDNDEIAYFKQIRNFFAVIRRHQRKYRIMINVSNRELLRQSKLLDNIPKNVRLSIMCEGYHYGLKKYLNHEKKLEDMIAPIRDSNLTTYEKYKMAHRLAKHYKKYKESDDSLAKSAKLYYILDDDNEFMSCAAYAKLEEELLRRLGIPCIYLVTEVDISYDNINMEKAIKDIEEDVLKEKDKPLDLALHARVLVKINDPEYGHNGINGIYLSDPTWDSYLPNIEFSHYSSVTFDQMKESRRLEKLNDIDLLFDFHDINEFRKKLAYYLKKEKTRQLQGIVHSIPNREVYKKLYKTIMDILKRIDQNEFITLRKKYEAVLNSSETSDEELDEVITRFTTDFYNYIMPLTNKRISFSTSIMAEANAMQKLYGLSQEEKNALIAKMTANNKSVEGRKLPYIYDPNSDRDNYLKAEIDIKNNVDGDNQKYDEWRRWR